MPTYRKTLARHSPAWAEWGTALAITTEVGGLPGTDDVFSKFDVLVSSIAGALSGKSGGKS